MKLFESLLHGWGTDWTVATSIRGMSVMSEASPDNENPVGILPVAAVEGIRAGRYKSAYRSLGIGTVRRHLAVL